MLVECLRALLGMQPKAAQPIRRQPRRLFLSPVVGTPFKLAGWKEQADG